MAKSDVVLVPTSGGLGAEMPDIAARIVDGTLTWNSLELS